MPNILGNLRTVLDLLDIEVIRAASTYHWRKSIADAKWSPQGQPRSGLEHYRALARANKGQQRYWPKKWHTTGPIHYVTPTEHGANLVGSDSTISIAFLAPDLIRIRYLPTNASTDAEPISYAIERPLELWSPTTFACSQEKEAYLLQSTQMVVGVSLAEGQIFFATPNGQLLRTDIDAGWGTGGAVRHRAGLEEIRGGRARHGPHRAIVEIIEAGDARGQFVDGDRGGDLGNKDRHDEQAREHQDRRQQPPRDRPWLAFLEAAVDHQVERPPERRKERLARGFLEIGLMAALEQPHQRPGSAEHGKRHAKIDRDVAGEDLSPERPRRCN